MARPKVDDDTLEKAEEIINTAVSVPLPSSELSANQQLRIIVDAVYADLDKVGRQGAKLTIDKHDTSRTDFEDRL